MPLPWEGPTPARPRWRATLAMGLYQLAFACVFVAYLPVFLWRGLFDRAYWPRLRQRLGFLDVVRSHGAAVWIHGVSVGEVKAAGHMIARLRAQAPGVQIVLSTTTPNGHRVARQDHPDLPVIYASGQVTAIEQFDAVADATFVAKPYKLDAICALLERVAAVRH